jgi:hypothetical protein
MFPVGKTSDGAASALQSIVFTPSGLPKLVSNAGLGEFTEPRFSHMLT